MDDIIKILEPLEKSGLLTDGAIETVKHEMKKQEGRFLRAIMTPMFASLIAPMASSLTQPVVSSLINDITEKWVRRAGNGQQSGILLLLAFLRIFFSGWRSIWPLLISTFQEKLI